MLFDNIYISPLVISELEAIKTSDKSDHLKYLARQAVRDILDNKESLTKYASVRNTFKINRCRRKHKFLSDINDHNMICEAAILAETEPVTLVTSDATMYLFAQQFANLETFYFEPVDVHETPTEYCGWTNYYPTAEEMALLYSNPEMNTLKAKVNEYCKIYEGTELRDVLFWDGEKYRNLKYENIKNKFLGETVKPLNLEQKFAFDLLQNRNIPVKLLIGKPGSGKDYLMLLHALDLVRKGEKDKIIFIRNLVPFKDAPEIGYIKGTEQEKLAWGLGPIRCILGEEGLLQAQEEGIIETVNLGFIRGMSWDNTIIYVSEGQNITGGGYKLLISRCGSGSELWINGDTLQTDDKKFDKNNGIERLIDSLTDNHLFSVVKLVKTERSETAELAAII